MKRKVIPLSAPAADLWLLTIEQFAALIGWHPESVRRAIRQGRLHAIKLGRQWRIPPETLNAVRLRGIPNTGGAR